MTSNHKAGWIGVMVFTLAFSSYGETSLSGATVINGNGGNSGSTESLVNDGLQKNLVDTKNIVDNSQKNSENGREYKAGDAQRQANAGKAAAIATGVGLVATATPMLASIIPSVRAAGAVLMAKAGLEFAQAGASGKVANQNRDQKDLLKRDDGQSGSQSAGTEKGSGAGDGGAASEAAKQLQNNPQLQDMLAKQGVNSDDFINRLASGQITNPEDVLAASGSEPVSSNDIAQAASSNLISGNPEPNGTRDTLRVVNDDGAKAAQVASGDRSAGGGGSIPGGPGGAAGSAQAALAASAASGLTGVAGGKSGAVLDPARKALQDALAAANGLDPSGLLGGLGGLFGTSGSSGSRPWTTGELIKMGIVKLAPKQNIFMLAHRNYRAFQKWRKGEKPKRVARNP